VNRREFLVRMGGTLIAVPFVLEAVGCGSDNNPTNPNDPSFAKSSNPDGTGHSHSITIHCSQLTTSGATFTSTSVNGHSHSVTLDMTQLQQIAAGASVGPITSSSAASHTHQWTIQKPAGTC
jgi:hypothetical protein